VPVIRTVFLCAAGQPYAQAAQKGLRRAVQESGGEWKIAMGGRYVVIG